MAHLSLPPSEIISRAATELTEQADAARCRAITKAQYHLTVSDLAIVPTSSGFLVPSGSRGGIIHRVSTVNGCSCEAAQHGGRGCWHVEAIKLLEVAAKYTMPRLVKRQPNPETVKALAEMDELFN